MSGLNVTRREFLSVSAAAGAGLVLAFYFPERASSSSATFAPNAWLKVSPEGEVTIVVARSEMGQGVRTALPMLVAEELEADWSKIRLEQAPANRELYGDQTTGGSASVREGWEPLRKAGATAREMLIAAAAARWGVPASECRAENGAVLHAATSRRLGYGELATEAASQPVPADVRLKEAKDFRLIGKPTRRLDTPSKVDGSAEFSLDFRVPGMLYAVVARSPAFGAKLKSLADKDARAVPGVRKVLPLADDGVAVVADSVWPAMEGRRALDLQWDDGPNARLNSAAIRRQFEEAAKRGGYVWRNQGNFAAAFAQAAKKLEATYEVPYVSHAPMEPENCTAHFQGDHCEVWAPTQVPQQTQREVARAVGLGPAAVRVNVTLLGGGFGRRLEEDFAVEAALISKASGAPVKVVWSREDDMRHDFYRPASLHRMSGALDAEGWPAAFAHTVAAPSILARWNEEIQKSGRDRVVMNQTVVLYSIPNLKLEYAMVNPAVPVGFWRSVFASQSAYAQEAFLDELARLGGKDPLEVRRRLLSGQRAVASGEEKYTPSRLLGALELAAAKAGWGKPLAKGRFRGIACFPAFDSYCAQVAEVSVEEGEVRVHRVVCAIDCGLVVNPDTVAAQMEGGVLFGLSAALKSQITIENGGVKQGNFDDYEVLRLREAPEVEVHIVPSSARPTGAGEPGVPPVAPAVANAVLAATGKPARKLPMNV